MNLYLGLMFRSQIMVKFNHLDLSYFMTSCGSHTGAGYTDDLNSRCFTQGYILHKSNTKQAFPMVKDQKKFMNGRDYHKGTIFELVLKRNKEVGSPWKNATCLNNGFQLGTHWF